MSVINRVDFNTAIHLPIYQLQTPAESQDNSHIVEFKVTKKKKAPTNQRATSQQPQQFVLLIVDGCLGSCVLHSLQFLHESPFRMGSPGIICKSSRRGSEFR